MEILVNVGIRWLSKYSKCFCVHRPDDSRLREVEPLLRVKLLNARDCGLGRT
jgi:hypothetical protein